MWHFNKLSAVLGTLLLLLSSCKYGKVGAENISYKAFSYREPYFSYNADKNISDSLKTNSVDRDWGIWGHNLDDVFGEDTPPKSVYALVDGERVQDQYCFLSESLYCYLVQYIEENFGDGTEKSYRFMIMPNDNNIVCQCEQCKIAGNTRNSATPAVSEFISAIAKRYPKHVFFTSSYLTTSVLPASKLPNNTGVIISTIDLPKYCSLDDKSEIKDKFKKQISQWKDRVGDVYLWDYASNFDDYFTPMPVLSGIRSQFIFFKECEVDGIFVNGSGESYSSFDDMKTHVLSALMIDPNQNIGTLVHNYYKTNYPCSGDILENYYMSIENSASQHGKPLHMYGGMKDAVNTFLNVPEFIAFYDSLNARRKNCTGKERVKLDKLITALSFTRLSLAYNQKDGKYGCVLTDASKNIKIKKDLLPVLSTLENYKKFDNMNSYSEFGGELFPYVDFWKTLINRSQYVNKLVGIPLTVYSELDEDYTDYSVLNDGLPGFKLDYHMGWLINSIDDLHIEFDPTTINSAKTLDFSFLCNSKRKMYEPSKIEIFKDGHLYKTIKGEKSHVGSEPYVSVWHTDVNLSGAKKVSFIIYRSEILPRVLLVTDEIRLY